MSLSQLVLCQFDVIEGVGRVFVDPVDHNLVLIHKRAKLLKHARDVVQAALDGLDCLVSLRIVRVHLHLSGISLIDFATNLRITYRCSILNRLHLVDMVR
jgi:hypothetical protein